MRGYARLLSYSHLFSTPTGRLILGLRFRKEKTRNPKTQQPPMYSEAPKRKAVPAQILEPQKNKPYLQQSLPILCCPPVDDTKPALPGLRILNYWNYCMYSLWWVMQDLYHQPSLLWHARKRVSSSRLGSPEGTPRLVGS